MNRITLGDPCDYLDWRVGSGNTIEIYDIVVGSERRKGKGRLLVDRLLKLIEGKYRLLWAITRTDNRIAQEFYERLNFRVVALLRNFYEKSDYADAVMYGRDLDSFLEAK